MNESHSCLMLSNVLASLEIVQEPNAFFPSLSGKTTRQNNPLHSDRFLIANNKKHHVPC